MGGKRYGGVGLSGKPRKVEKGPGKVGRGGGVQNIMLEKRAFQNKALGGSATAKSGREKRRRGRGGDFSHKRCSRRGEENRVTRLLGRVRSQYRQ